MYARIYDYRVKISYIVKRFCTLKLNVHICADMFSKRTRLCKTTQGCFGDTYRRTRNVTCARRRRVRHRVACARGGWSRSCALEQAGQMGGVWRHFNGVGHAPLLAYRLESCPPDGRDARARREPVWRSPTHDNAIATDRSTTTGIPPFAISSPLPISTLLFTHTIARVPLAWFHRTMKTASAARFMAFYLITFYRDVH